MAKRIQDEYKTKYGRELTFATAFSQACNSLAVYLEGCKKAGSIETDKVIKALETGEIPHFYGISTASGEETFGIKRFFTHTQLMVKTEGYELKTVLTLDIPNALP